LGYEYVLLCIGISWLITLGREQGRGRGRAKSRMGIRKLIPEEVRKRGKIGLNQSLKIQTSVSPTFIQLFIFPSSTQYKKTFGRKIFKGHCPSPFAPPS
jgi:hypothetical protein